MVSHFSEYSIFKYDDLVCVPDCGQSMSNNYDGNVSLCGAVSINSILYELLVYLIKGRSCLVKQ